MGYIEGSRKRPYVVAGEPDETTLAGEAGPGDLLVDSSTGNLYVNAGTSGTPSWSLVGEQPGEGSEEPEEPIDG